MFTLDQPPVLCYLVTGVWW